MVAGAVAEARVVAARVAQEVEVAELEAVRATEGMLVVSVRTMVSGAAEEVLEVTAPIPRILHRSASQLYSLVWVS